MSAWVLTNHGIVRMHLRQQRGQMNADFVRGLPESGRRSNMAVYTQRSNLRSTPRDRAHPPASPPPRPSSRALQRLISEAKLLPHHASFLQTMVQYAGWETGDGITANAVAPGPVEFPDTGLTEEMKQAIIDQIGFGNSQQPGLVE